MEQWLPLFLPLLQCICLPRAYILIYTYTHIPSCPKTLQNTIVFLVISFLQFLSLPLFLSLSLLTFCVHIISVSMFICLSFLMTLRSKRSYSSISLARIEVSNSVCLPLQWILLSALSARHNQWVTSKH